MFLIPEKFSLIHFLLQKLIKRGHKIKALKFSFEVFKNIRKIKNQDPYHVFGKALNNIQPVVGLEKVPQKKFRGKKKRRKFFLLPQYIKPSKAFRLSMLWITKCTKKRSEKKLTDRLTFEIVDCFDDKSNTLTLLKKQEIYNVITENRPFFFIIRFRKKKKSKIIEE